MELTASFQLVENAVNDFRKINFLRHKVVSYKSV